jgi:membrane associated rhomboid family serine protease
MMPDYASLVAAAAAIFALLVAAWALRQSKSSNGKPATGATQTAPADQVPGTEQLNQLARSFCLVSLTLAFIYGFIGSKVVSTESFAVIFNTVLIWWFTTANRRQQAEEVKEAVKAVAEPAAVAVKTAEERAVKAEAKAAAAPASAPPAL